MENQLELFVNSDNRVTVGKIDLYGDEPISLSISVSDIKDISKRNSTFSQTFTIPASKNNNVLLNHIFNIGSDSTFDPTKKTPCYILNETVSVFTGNFQLTKINVKNSNVISYECVVYGEVIDLVKSLGDSLLTDLDFSELDHNRDAETILASWSAETKDLGYYYPLIDYGYDLDIRELNDGTLSVSVVTGNPTVATSTTLTDTTQSWTTNIFATPLNSYTVSIISGTGQGQTRTILSNVATVLTISNITPWTVVPDVNSVYTINKIDASNPYSSNGTGLKPSIFKPAVSNTYLLKKIMSNIGFVLDSAFVDSDIFAETIMPFNGIDAGLNNEDVRTFQAYLEQPFEHYPSGVFNQANLITFPFSDDGVDKGNDRSQLYNNATFKYTAPVSATPLDAEFFVHLSYNYNLTYLPSGELPFETFFVRYYRSSFSMTNPFKQDVVVVDRCPGYYWMGPAGTTPPPPGAALGPHQITSKSTYITLVPGEQIWVEIYVNASSNALWQIYDTNSAFYNRIYTNGAVDNYIQMNDFIPKQVKQIDYVKSVITMFNLMVIPTKGDPHKLQFIPREEYYNSGVIKDWTSKVDHNEKIEETLISEQQNKRITFSYKPDKDYYNTDYTDKISRVYGDMMFEFDNEWVEGTKKIEVVFSPTPVDKVFGSDDIYLPKISKRDAKSGIYDRTDFNIRFLRKNRNLMPTANTIKILGLPAMNSYPYCGHLDHPVNPTFDYNFGTVPYVYYPELVTNTSNNLVEEYWQQYLNDIADKNSKLIKCKIYLTPNDISQFDYNDVIFIDGLTSDGGHYFIVNKITYTPTSNQPSVVELIKVNKKPKERRPAYTTHGPIKMNPIRSLDVGKRNYSDSTGYIINGTGNVIGQNSDGVNIIGGDNNVIADNTPGVTIINGSGYYVDTPFVTIVGNTYFNPNGTSYVLYNDIESGLDEVINIFSTASVNDIESGLNTVIGFGSTNPVKDIDSGISDDEAGILPFTP